MSSKDILPFLIETNAWKKKYNIELLDQPL